MAGSFSGHLVNSFLQAQQPRGPFGQPLPLQTATHGAMSFAPSMHGTQASSSSMSLGFGFNEPSFMDLSQESASKIATLQAKLNKKLGPEYISQRPGPGGGPKLTYAEGWKIINLANEVFGFNGWSSNVVSLTTDFVDFSEQSQRYTVGVTAVVRVTLRDGVFHEDIGYGMLENSKSKGGALDKCKKEAVTDAVKRALRNFGNLLGNCLYDKQYAQEVVKIKVPPPKFDRSELHRRPEFEERKPDISTIAPPSKPAVSATVPSGTTAFRSDATVNIDSQQQKIPPKPLSPVPPHMRANSPLDDSSVKGKSPVERPAYQPRPAWQTNVPPPKDGFNTPEQSLAHSAFAQRASTSTTSAVPQKPLQQPALNHVNLKHATHGAQVKAEVVVPPTTSAVQADEADDSVPETKSYEEYDLRSEDDAFFANVDLGEGDSGIGGPIDFEEGASGLDHEDQQPPLLEAVQQPATSMHESFEHPELNPQQPARYVRVPPGNGPEKAVAMNRDTPVGNTAVRTGNASARSMGGFHFPPGFQAKPPQPPAAVAGSKRSADTMLASSSRRPLQGMGLSHKQTTHRREPLAQLDIGPEAGDMKRVRR